MFAPKILPFSRRSFKTVGPIAVLLLAMAAAAGAPAQDAAEDETALRDKAFLLWERGNQLGALPFLEKLAVLRPNDIVVLERLGAALGGSAVEVLDPDERKKIVLRARSILLRAKELGDKSDYLNIMLEQLPENGELTAFSTNKEVDKAVSEGEAAFGKGDFAGALKAYQLAYDLDPNSYAAALFTGDVYYNLNQMDKAGEWFAKAAQIDPNRETAHRYWADGLLKEGKIEEARAKYIEAIVAEPYGNASWSGLRKWAKRQNATIAHPKIESKASVSGEDNKINITIDPSMLGDNKKEEGVSWIIYAGIRALWRGERFNKEFPNEKTYRHSLREEVDALEAGLPTIPEDAKKAKKERKKLDAEAQTLLKLKESGLLEAYVLISRADNGIAQDYAAYRAAHRDKLIQYISEVIISTEPAKK